MYVLIHGRLLRDVGRDDPGLPETGIEIEKTIFYFTSTKKKVFFRGLHSIQDLRLIIIDPTS